ncbi:MAG: hypothetical protein WC794_01150 [Candidatus Doudnabacteria bacterium]|jgi:hypothetical protein
MNWISKNWGKVLTFVLLALVGMRLLDLLMLWGIFSSFTSRFRGLGITNDYLVNALSVAMMTIVALLIHHLVWKFILRRTQEGTLIFGVAITAWMLVMYFISVPKTGEYFNPVTGQPRFVYTILPSGEIDTKPLGYKYHPKTGEEMVPLTKEAIKQHADKMLRLEQRQAQGQPTASYKPPDKPEAEQKPTAEYPRFLTNPILSFGHDIPLPENKVLRQTCAQMRVDSIRLMTQGLCLRVKYQNACTDSSLALDRPSPYNTYVVTNTGEGLRVSEFPVNTFPDNWTAGNFFTGPSMHTRDLLPNETWVLEMWFPPLKEPAKQLTFTPQTFDKVEITLLD